MKKKVIAIGLTIIGIFIVFFILFFKIYRKYQITEKLKYSTNIEEYGNFSGFRGFSNLDIFPQKILDSAKNVDFYYKDDSTPIFDDSCQVYLKCTYNESDYQNEFKRLTSITEQYQGEKHTTWLDKTNYNYPSVVAIENNNHCNEYALLDENNLNIIYIYLQFIHKKDIVFESNYLPLNYTNPEEQITKSDEGKSIYLFDLSNGDKYGTDGKWLKEQ